jgi:energy-coupling factor transport system substrate-specific component
VHATTTDEPVADAAPRRARSLKWRPVDIVVAAVLAVAAGVVFWVWDLVSNPVGAPIGAALPGLQGLINGPWLFAGVLVGLVVRKPGAALFGELVAASVSALLGTVWGPLTLVSGLVQGLGVELVFAILLYRRWGLGAALLGGFGAGVAESVLDLTVWYPAAKPLFDVLYAVGTMVSGTVIAGIGSWLLVKALARTGALSRFASGREAVARS